MPSNTDHQPPKHPSNGRHHRSKPSKLWLFLLRIDVLWTFLFFVFLVCVAAIITSITQTRISDALLDNLHNIHFLHVNAVTKKADLFSRRAFNMAAGFLTLHSETAVPMGSEETLATLCSILTQYDITRKFRSLSFTSLESKEAISCMHNDISSKAGRQIYGWITEDSVIPGVYEVNSTNYHFKHPLQTINGIWPPSEYNLSGIFTSILDENAIFSQAMRYYNGLVSGVDVRKLWRSFLAIPHIIYCFIPVGFLFRGLPLPTGMSVTDYVDVRINGASILLSSKINTVTNITAAIFINATLTDKDPSIMSNTWGQASTNDTEIVTTQIIGQVSYLKVSGITDPLMRAALKHVKLKELQSTACNRTVDFQYHGAPATVTAVTLTLSTGLILPMVFVTSHADIAMPYRRIMDICNGMNAVAIVLFTALFWLFLNRQLRSPLHRIATLLLLSVKRGSRALFRANRHDCVALTEVQQLGDAHNTAMRQLREVDKFVPKYVREQIARGVHPTPSMTASSDAPPALADRDSLPPGPDTLVDHLSTAVCITVRPCEVAPADANGGTPRRRLVSVVEHAARAAELVNSGPFPTPAALEGFVAALHRCCDECDGTVLRLAPDSCVVHFGKAVRAHLARRRKAAAAAGRAGAERGEAAAAEEEDADTDVCAARDARCALRFAFALLRWVDHCDAPRMPDVRVLVDTAVFACGQYRPRGSEQTLSVALGRDVQRKLGHVPASIGVRVAMTEETATYVRAGHVAGSVGGVRQIPVEAFHVGRVGLNADVIILFEALPGRVDDEAWRLYFHYCTRAFSALVRGNYTRALREYKDVAGIADLEPGLVPHSLRREAAMSKVEGGAVSTQVERLMRECVRRAVQGDERPFVHERYVPLGIDAVMARMPPTAAVSVVQQPAGVTVVPELQRRQSQALVAKLAMAQLPLPKATDRRVVVMQDGTETIRSVIASPPEWVQDNSGLRWSISSRLLEQTPEAFWMARLPCLGSAGAIASASFAAYRDVPPVVANAIKEAPEGLMSDVMRSCIPVVSITPQQKAAMHTLYLKQCQLQHPNLMVPLGYSTSSEGGVILIWEYNAGGTLRELAARYYQIKPITAARFMHGIISAIAYLHRRGIVHAAVRLDNILVGADGVCRLRGQLVDRDKFSKIVVMPRTCYVSPAMAAGAAPTPACDVFCYGLMCIEVLTGAKAWAWAPVEDGQPQRTDEELAALMKAAKEPFYSAVAAGRIVANTSVIVGRQPSSNAKAVQTQEMLLACLSVDPSKRPTAHAAHDMVVVYLAQSGFDAREEIYYSLNTEF